MEFNEYIMIDKARNWMSANQYCMNNLNTTMAIISTEKQFQNALNACNNDDSCWIAASNLFFNTYQWIDGSSFKSQKFMNKTINIHSTNSTHPFQCISINNTQNKSIFYEQCSQKRSFLCNSPNQSNKPKCNYFISDSNGKYENIPHPINHCSFSNAMDNDALSLYSCNSNKTTSIQMHLFDTNDTTNHQLQCDDMNEYAVIKMDITNDINTFECNSIDCDANRDIATAIDKNDNEIDIVIGLCLKTTEHTTFYTQISCDNNAIMKSIFSDQKCSHFVNETVLFENDDIIFCPMTVTPFSAKQSQLNSDDNDADDGQCEYVNTGNMAIPMHKCQTINEYGISFQYICKANSNQIIKQIWWNSLNCSENSDYFNEIPMNSNEIVSYYCNNDGFDTTNDNCNSVDIAYYDSASNDCLLKNHQTNSDLIYSQSVITDECFITSEADNANSSYEYQCTDNGFVYKLLYKTSDNCSQMINDDVSNIVFTPIWTENDGICVITNCNDIGLFSTTTTDHGFSDNMDDGSNAYMMYIILAGIMASACLMLAVAAIAVMIQFYKNEENESGTQRTMELSKNTNQTRQSVVSYDVVDNGDLPGIDLYYDSKRPSYQTPPVSEFSAATNALTETPRTVPDHLPIVFEYLYRISPRPGMKKATL